MSNSLSQEDAKSKINKYAKDILRPLQSHGGLELWVMLLALGLVMYAFAYFLQLRDGLGRTAMRDYVSWGLYISNFVFFVAVSLVGMLISAVLSLLNQNWVKPLTRVSEVVALGFVMVAGLVIVNDMGRPDRLLNVFIYGRIQSPIVWDITVITTYVTISALLFYLPLIPDLAFAKKRLKNLPKWQYQIFNILSLGWIGTAEQYKILHKSIRILAILIVPVALAIHTVTSWLFAATLRPGWDTTIFGPYFVAGAFVAGAAAVVIVMYILRVNYKLKDYFTDFHFNKMGQLLVLVSLIYAYFNLNEFLVPAYKMRTAEAHHLNALFTGQYAMLFWGVQIFGLVVPIIMMLFKKFRKPGWLTVISVFVLAGAWLKRVIIVIPTLIHPYLPIQNVPESFHHYFPTWIEIFVTLGSFAVSLSIITVLLKIFPVIPIWELAEEEGITKEFESHE